MSKTKIVIIQLKEIVYTAIFAALGILLIVLLVFMFMPDKKKGNDSAHADAVYTPGVYTSQLSLGEKEVNLEVVVDEDHINSVSLTDIDESVATMYPLVKPTVDTISEQLSSGVALSELEASEENQYTQVLLIDSIEKALDKARIE